MWQLSSNSTAATSGGMSHLVTSCSQKSIADRAGNVVVTPWTFGSILVAHGEVSCSCDSGACCSSIPLLRLCFCYMSCSFQSPLQLCSAGTCSSKPTQHLQCTARAVTGLYTDSGVQQACCKSASFHSLPTSISRDPISIAGGSRAPS